MIYAIKAPNVNDYDDFSDYQNVMSALTKSLNDDGYSRFGWGFFDINQLKDKDWSKMSEDEADVWKRTSFLLDVKQDDWLVHVNFPEYGKCTACKVIGEYEFRGQIEGDFAHSIKIDKNSIVVFDRNDDGILPVVSRRLKLQGRYWRIYFQEEFEKSIANIKNGVKLPATNTKEIHYLKEEFSNILPNITSLIQKNHPEKKLEHFFKTIFEKIPNVVNVENYGETKGFGTDFGADLIVRYKSGLPILDLETEKTLVVQVKSYDGDHYDTNAVDQIETAIDKFGADAGLIITTGNKTQTLEDALEALCTKKNLPISLIAGEDVAKFVLKYAPDLLV